MGGLRPPPGCAGTPPPITRAAGATPLYVEAATRARGLRPPPGCAGTPLPLHGQPVQPPFTLRGRAAPSPRLRRDPPSHYTGSRCNPLLRGGRGRALPDKGGRNGCRATGRSAALPDKGGRNGCRATGRSAALPDKGGRNGCRATGRSAALPDKGGRTGCQCGGWGVPPQAGGRAQPFPRNGKGRAQPFPRKLTYR